LSTLLLLLGSSISSIYIYIYYIYIYIYSFFPPEEDFHMHPFPLFPFCSRFY
jgi:hypothetical protein